MMAFVLSCVLPFKLARFIVSARTRDVYERRRRMLRMATEITDALDLVRPKVDAFVKR